MLSPIWIPETGSYMIAGYIIFGLVISSYLLSLYLRWRKARKDFLELQGDE